MRYFADKSLITLFIIFLLVTDNNEEPLRLNSANNALNSDNLEMTIDEADKSSRDLYNNSSIQEQIDYSIAYNNENLNYDGKKKLYYTNCIYYYFDVTLINIYRF